ncbi:MAG: hypothetical protein EOP39_01815 [Rubrivivax sp.]|nr:MAG: hypothetical protein EOP39_01815 [Rubrivivax sp.]
MSTFVERLFAELRPGVTFAECIRRSTPASAHVLEIGPGASPTFRRKDFPNLKVSDYCGTDDLQRSLERHVGATIAHQPFDDVDYVCADGRLADVVPEGQKFDLIFSSHNIEHQPDLLTHLIHVEKLLGASGVVTFLVPHHRHTFDIFRRLTNTGDVLLAHFGPPGVMAAKVGFEARTQSALLPNGADRSYGPEAPVSLGKLKAGFDRFMSDVKGEGLEFEDYHHHIFSTESLQLLMLELYLLRLTTLLPCASSGAVGNTFLMAAAATPWPEDPAQSAVLEANLESQRLALYRKLAEAAGMH